MDRALINRIFEPARSTGVRITIYRGNYDEILERARRPARDAEASSFENQASNLEIEREKAMQLHRPLPREVDARPSPGPVAASSRSRRLESRRAAAVRIRARSSFKFPKSPRARSRERGHRDPAKLSTPPTAINRVLLRGRLHPLPGRQASALVGVERRGEDRPSSRSSPATLEPTGGTIELGHNVRASYYAQHHAELLHAKNTVYDEAASVNRELSQTRVRTVLGSFLFSGDDVEKLVGVLSGGERARVALAKLLLESGQPAPARRADEPPRPRELREPRRHARHLRRHDGVREPQPRAGAPARDQGSGRSRTASSRSTPATSTTTCASGERATAARTRPRRSRPRSPRRRPSKRTTRRRRSAPARRRSVASARRPSAARSTARTVGKLEKKAQKLLERIDELETLQKERNDKLCDPAAFANESERFETAHRAAGRRPEDRGAHDALGGRARGARESPA